MSIKITAKKEEEKYPLEIKNLQKGQFAEAKNGTIVICTGSEIINVENGVGGYSKNSRFRLIPNHRIEFETGADSKAQYRENEVQ